MKDINNQSVLNELNRIYQRDNALTPEAVVDEAQSELSPLHDYFDWNDESAAFKHRLWEARELIRSVKVTIDGRQVQAFWNVKVKVDDQNHQAYHSVHTVMSNKDMYAYTVEEALRELRYWEDKYSDIQKLYNLVNHEALVRAEELVKNGQ